MTTIEVKTQRIVVNPPSGKIDIFGYGPAGPAGPPGPPGSGATIAWPIVAPANSTGNITFTPSSVQNDIRGLQSPDAASWIRAWSGPPFAWYLRANSGPLTAGLLGQTFFDADRHDFRDSPGTTALAIFAKTGHTINLGVTFTGALQANGTLSVTGAITANSTLTAVGAVTTNALTVNGVLTANAIITCGPQEAIRFPTVNQHITWFNGGTRIGYLQGTAGGMILNGEVGRLDLRGVDGLQLTPAKINGYTMSESNLGYRIVCTTNLGYIYCNYFNTSADVGGDAPYIAGQTGDNFIRWYTSMNANKISWGTTAGQITTTRIAGSAYWDQSLYNNSSATMAGLGYHPGGVAGSIRMQVNNAQYHFNNVAGDWYYPTMASGYGVASSLDFKHDVVSLVMPVGRPIDYVHQLRPVWFQTPSDLQEPMELRDDKGELLEVRYLTHDCDTSPHCDGTNDDPCNRVRTFNRGRIGLIAQELAEVFPTLSVTDNDHIVVGYDLPGLVALLVGAIRNLTDDQHSIDLRLLALEERNGDA